MTKQNDVDAVIDYRLNNGFYDSELFNSIQNLYDWDSRKNLSYYDVVDEAIQAINRFNDTTFTKYELSGVYKYGGYIIPTRKLIADIAEGFMKRLPNILKEYKYKTVPFEMPSRNKIMKAVNDLWYKIKINTNTSAKVRAYKTTPKRKTGLCKLENSVRKMW